MKRLLIIGLAFTVCDALYAEEDMTGLSLREAEKCFLEHNVQLTAQRYNVDRAQAQVVQARLFDNPVISLEQNVYNRLNGKYFDVGKEGEAAIEIEQEIPIARQRSKRIKLEEINREAAGYRFEEVLRTLRSELYRSFVDTYYQSRSVRSVAPGFRRTAYISKRVLFSSLGSEGREGFSAGVPGVISRDTLRTDSPTSRRIAIATYLGSDSS